MRSIRKKHSQWFLIIFHIFTSLKLIRISEVYYKIPTIRFGMYRIHRSFTGTFKTLLLHYGLWNKNCFWCILFILHYIKHSRICTYLWGALQGICYKNDMQACIIGIASICKHILETHKIFRVQYSSWKINAGKIFCYMRFKLNFKNIFSAKNSTNHIQSYTKYLKCIDGNI